MNLVLTINQENRGIAFQLDSRLRELRIRSAKRSQPNEIPFPGKDPDTIPSEEPEPGVWPQQEPEIQPEREPLTVPPPSPHEVPDRPKDHTWAPWEFYF